MYKSKIVTCVVIAMMVSACGNDEQPGEDGTNTVVEVENKTATATEECGNGGTMCPAGLECVTWRNGSQACGPMSVASLVLIKDATLGGGCLSPNPADPLPGASLASVHVIGNDGKVSGYGRLIWDQPGFEVAADRGTPPTGTRGTEDACNNYYNLGCDGRAVFEIINESGETQKLREGQLVIAHMRGQETCGEEVADGLEAAICNDPAAAAGGNLDSCEFRVEMSDAPEEMFGPDRMGGTIQYIGQK